MNLQKIAKEKRVPDHEIDEMFYTRWSPRAMSGEEISQEELMPLFEAARWAPSSYNGQPWHFIVALTKDNREKFMSFLVDFNKQWCKNASALVVIVSRNDFESNGKANPHHSFDTGSAWCSLALEGARQGYVMHGMAGFDAEKVRQELKIPQGFSVEAMCAIGRLAEKSVLPDELQTMETPSMRKKVEEFTSFDGKFGWS